MSDITERLQHAADYFPRIEDNPYSVFVDAKTEIEQLREKLAALRYGGRVLLAAYSAQGEPLPLSREVEILSDALELSGDDQ